MRGILDNGLDLIQDLLLGNLHRKLKKLFQDVDKMNVSYMLKKQSNNFRTKSGLIQIGIKNLVKEKKPEVHLENVLQEYLKNLVKWKIIKLFL